MAHGNEDHEWSARQYPEYTAAVLNLHCGRMASAMGKTRTK